MGIFSSFKSLISISIPRYKKSYSQCGEDLIIQFILNYLKISQPSYLDIGAYHPTAINNTFLLYLNGGKGVCIEPDPFLFKQIKMKRRRDICLNVGVGKEESKKMDFYCMTIHSLNTFSIEQANRCQSEGTAQIKSIIEVPIMTINSIIFNHFKPYPNFISLDTEGFEMDILQSFDFSKFKTEVFCIETIDYTIQKKDAKRLDIIDFMKSKEYFVYADTYINTIFVNKPNWENRYV